MSADQWEGLEPDLCSGGPTSHGEMLRELKDEIMTGPGGMEGPWEKRDAMA